MLSRKSRHLIAQRIFWSAAGRLSIRSAAKIARLWNYVVLNRSLNSEVNGEYWLISLLPPKSLVIDVGFNRGEFSANVIQRIPDARAIGFDPAATMRHQFDKDYPYKDRVELISAAVSNVEGSMLFVDSADGVSHLVSESSDNLHAYRVPVCTLDQFASSRKITKIHFLKVDAEGYDLAVLEGATSLLESGTIDIFMFEFNEPWIASRRFLQEADAFLSDKPYRLFSLFNGFLTPFTYTHHAERHDLGCNYVGVSVERLKQNNILIRVFP